MALSYMLTPHPTNDLFKMVFDWCITLFSNNIRVKKTLTRLSTDLCLLSHHLSLVAVKDVII